MNPEILIRTETSADIDAITEVTTAAFKTLEISNHMEQFIIKALRAAKALTVSLVAELYGRVIGHVAFSPVAISDGTQDWYGLGPVSVLPEHQRQGIGKALIQQGLSRLKALNARGCCLVGHPDYYKRFGFKNMPGFVHEGVPPEVFLALTFDGHIPQGTVAFHEGFKADGQQVAPADGRLPPLSFALTTFGIQQSRKCQIRKYVRYLIYVLTFEGETELMDLPFLSPKSPFFRSHDLTPRPKLRYVSDIAFVSK
jgi:putative acetyltransferase